MKRLQAFKFELRPDGAQRQQMRCFAGSCRFVYNKGLALQKARFDAGEKKLSYVELCKRLTDWRNDPEIPWLKEAPTHPLQQVLKDLERAYTNFFAQRADFPRFKKKGQHNSFRYPDPRQIRLDQGNSRLFLPKLGWLRYRNSRKVLGTVKNLTVSGSCDKNSAAASDRGQHGVRLEAGNPPHARFFFIDGQFVLHRRGSIDSANAIKWGNNPLYNRTARAAYRI